MTTIPDLPAGLLGQPMLLTPAGGISPRSALATSIQANPGVYAVLVGSGVSSAAGIPTGWQVVEDLIGRIARARGVELDAMGIAPSAWWDSIGGPPMGYDTLLEALAPTPAARQGLLRSYFEPDPGDPNLRSPTAAHHALADLCAAGYVRVVVTTNFDRLIERALADAGVTPQVIDGPEAARTMTPLVHSPVTVVKVHGDYLATNLRNTPEELGHYPEELETLLHQIFDEYGLVVVGWSGDHDRALATSVSNVRDRRYPMYWGAHDGHLSEEAARIVERRRAHVVRLGSADEFLVDLAAQVDRLAMGARRRREFVVLRHPINYPDQSVILPGWNALPLLTVRVYASLEPATVDDVGIIGPEVRERIIESLTGSAVASYLGSLGTAFTPVDPMTGARVAQPPDPSNRWVHVGDHQSIDYARLGWGGDTAAGVNALATVALPTQNRLGGVGVTLDVGLSVAEVVAMEQVALLLRDGIVLVASTLPAVITDLLPLDAALARVEGSFLASTFTGRDEPGQRENELRERVAWSSLDTPPDRFGPLCGFAVRPSEPPGPAAAAQIVVEGINHMVLAHGFIDPRSGIASLRDLFGLESTTGQPPAPDVSR